MGYFTFIQDLQSKGVKERTCKEYRRRLNDWIYYLFFNHKVYNLTDATTEQFLAYKEELINSNKSKNTINGILSTVSIFYEMAVDKKIIDVNPCKKGSLIYEPIEKPKELSKIELKLINKWIYSLPERYRLPIKCILASGLRAGTIAKLTKDDVIDKKGKIFIHTYDHEWQGPRLMPVMDPKTAGLLFIESRINDNEYLFDVTKKEIIALLNSLSVIRNDFHHYLFKYTLSKRLERNNVPEHAIQYIFGEGGIPKHFKKIDPDKHTDELLKYNVFA